MRQIHNGVVEKSHACEVPYHRISLLPLGLRPAVGPGFPKE
jgi:hypothetical protein